MPAITKQKIVEILRNIDVPYFTEGKNVSPDTVNIKCPFCDDQSNHLGIFEGSGLFSCWRCRKKGPLAYLIQELTGLPRDKCDEMVTDGQTSFKRDPADEIRRIIDGEIEIADVRKHEEFAGVPQYFEKITTSTKFPLLDAYMKRRDIKLKTLIQYGCGICRVGKYMNRMVIPVIFGGEVVDFQAADLTGTAELKYRGSPGEINNYLYNYDAIGHGGRIILVEGILDMWRVEDSCVASFGTHLTNRQKRLILDKQPSELIFLWDEDAWDKISRYNSDAGFFEPFIDSVRGVLLPKDEDPDSLGKEAVFQLIDDLEV